MLMNVPRYKHQSLADLNHLLVEPLLRDRIAIAYDKKDQGRAAVTPIGIAIWASVDDAADAKITEQVKSGSFPVRLTRSEWSSGEKVWLLDIVAPSQEAAGAVLTSFGKIVGKREVRLHPIVAQSVDAQLLEQLRLP